MKTKPKESEPLPELLPCRKCGKAPTYAMTESYDGEGDDKAHEVICYPCKVETGEYISVAAAYIAWNKIAKP